MAVILLSDIWLPSSAHPSVTTTLPLGIGAQAVSKLLTRLGFGMVVLVVTLLAGSVAALTGGVGAWAYPAALPLVTGWTVVSQPMAYLWLLVTCLGLLLVMASLALWLNAWSGNVYVTAVALLGLVALAWLWPAGNRWWWWTPLSTFAPTLALTGEVRAASGVANYGVLPQLGMQVIWSVGLLAGFGGYLRRQEG